MSLAPAVTNDTPAVTNDTHPLAVDNATPTVTNDTPAATNATTNDAPAATSATLARTNATPVATNATQLAVANPALPYMGESTAGALKHFASSLTLISTFAGGFTINSLLSISIPNPAPIQNFLAIAFILFGVSLFCAAYGQMIIYTESWHYYSSSISWWPHNRVPVVNAILILSGWFTVAGFILLSIVVLKVPLVKDGIVLLALIGVIAIIFSFFAFLGLYFRLNSKALEDEDNMITLEEGARTQHGGGDLGTAESESSSLGGVD